MKQIAYSKEAARTLRRMPANVAAMIRAKIDQYANDPASLANNVKALKGEPGAYRLRVGDWRIVFADDGTVISIIRIAARGSAYE
jgi:mRNA interferase RelE/StbE